MNEGVWILGGAIALVVVVMTSALYLDRRDDRERDRLAIACAAQRRQRARELRDSPPETHQGHWADRVRLTPEEEAAFEAIAETERLRQRNAREDAA